MDDIPEGWQLVRISGIELQSAEAKLAAVTAENERLANELNARKGDSVARLHNICAGIEEMGKDSPFSREAWEELDKENQLLTSKLAEMAAIIKYGLDNSLRGWPIMIDATETKVEDTREKFREMAGSAIESLPERAQRLLHLAAAGLRWEEVDSSEVVEELRRAARAYREMLP